MPVGIITKDDQGYYYQITKEFFNVPCAWHEPHILLMWLFKRAFYTGGQVLYAGVNFELVDVSISKSEKVWELRVKNE